MCDCFSLRQRGPVCLILLGLCVLLGAMPAQAQEYAFQRAVPAQPDDRYDTPTDVAVSYVDSTVYVADEDVGAVFRYRLDGTRRPPLRSVSANGRTYEFDEPAALSLGPDGTLFVADRGAQRLFAVRDDSTRSAVLGRDGGNLGELDEPGDVTTDTQGYTYALDVNQQYVPFFDEAGRFLSWIRGGTRPFDEARAVGTSGDDALYVLEASGASVTRLDAQGRVQKDLGRLARRGGASIEEPADLAVLPGGDFLILDREDGRITHFSRTGAVIGTFGAKGRGGSGTFRDPVRLSVAHGAPARVAVLDAEGRRAQLFRVPARPDTLSAPARKVGLQGRAAASPPPFVDAVRPPGAPLHYILRSDPSLVYRAASSGSNATLLTRVDEGRALAVGPDTSLYVLDEGTETVRQYDREGALIREFGKNLDDPTDLATLPSGHVLVAEAGREAVRIWSPAGVYESRLSISPTLTEPTQVAAHDSSAIYVLDADQHRIYQTALNGGGSYSSLRLRTEEVGENEGEVRGLEVDPLGQLHAFNVTTNQYEVYSWHEEPRALFRFGREGEGPFSFEDVVGFSFDDRRFVGHVLIDDGDAVRSVQLSVRPPAPSDSLRFHHAADTLVARVPPLTTPAVVGYSLLRLRPNGPPDTVATRPRPELPVPPPPAGSLATAPRYAVVSNSPTEASPPSAAFADHFGRAGHLFARGEHTAALRAYRTAIDSLALTDATQRYIAERYATLGRSLAASYDLENALRFLRAARSLAPDDTTGARALGFGYSQQLRRLANQERYDSLRTVTGTVLAREDTPAPARSALLGTVDSIAAQLRTRPSPDARSDAVSLYQGLRTWTDTSAQAAYRLADAHWGAYQAQRRAGAPAFEQNLALKNTRTATETALERLSPDAPFYHDAHLLLLDVLLAQDRPQRAVSIATGELQNNTAPMTADDEAAYRTALATAYRRLGKHDPAIREYRRLLSDHPDRTEYKLALADVLVDTEAYGRAKTLYQELRTQAPDNATYIARIGTLELKRGNFAEASLQLEKALQMNPDLSDARGALAQAYDGASNYTKAIETYRAAVKETRRRLDTTRTEAASHRTEAATDRLQTYLKNLGRLHMQLGQYDEATAAYKNLTEVAPSSVAAWHGLGTAYLESGRVYGALSALNRAINLDPSAQAVSQDLSRARSLRDKVSKNRPPVEIVDTNVDALFPSLYKNYSDPSKLPIGTVVLANNTELPKSNVTLTFAVKGLMDEPTEQTMKPLPSYSNTTIPLSAVFNESILQVTEQRTVQGRLQLSYRHGGETNSVDKTVSITLHGRNAIKWKDKRRLAAFISPRDPQLIDYVKKIDRLFRDASRSDLPTNVVTALRIYTVLTNDGYTYSVDPQTDFSVVSRNPEMLDYCQYPEETMQRKAGDCDDLVTLYLSLLANAGVPTAYVDIPGHVLSAFDTGLAPGDLSGSGLSRKEVVVEGESVWLPVETTLLGRKPFLTAWKKGIERYRQEQKEGDLPQLISMSAARSIYEPSSIAADTSLALPADTSALLSAYDRQMASLYARTTASKRRRLQDQLQNSPDNTVVRNQLAILYARGGQPKKARRLYEDGLDRSPTSPLLLNNYANVLYRQGRYEKAISLYKRSLSQGTDDPEVYMNLCKAQLALGRTDAAASSFETAIQKDPSLQAPYSYLQEQL